MPASLPSHPYQLIRWCVLILGNGPSILSLPCCGINNKGLGEEMITIQSVGIVCCCLRIILYYGLLLRPRLLLMLSWLSFGPWLCYHDAARIFWRSSRWLWLVFMLFIHVANVATPTTKTGLTSRDLTSILGPPPCHGMHYWKNKEIWLMLARG